jgi:hypothetical protein
MSKRVWHGSIVAMLFVAGVCTMAVVFSPSVTLGKDKEFVYDKAPAFSVTYPSNWSVDKENPWKVMFRVEAAAKIPVMDVQVLDIPKSVALADIGKYYKKAILDKEQKVDAEVVSDQLKALKDGTKVNEIVLKYKYQGWLDLQATIVSAYKDNKWVYVCINDSSYNEPLRNVLYSLKFK